MSGRKRTYVSVADDELARLRQAERRLADVRRDLPTVVEGVRKQVRKDFDRKLSAVDERQRRFDTRIAGLGDEVRSVEREAQRRLAEQNRRLRSEFDRGLGTVRAEVAARLDEQSRAVDAALAAETAARRRDVAALSDQVGALEASVRADREQAAAAARRWLEGAETLRAFIDAELAHQRFAPGRLAALTRQLADAQHNARAGMWQAAAVSAQSALRDLSELRATLELRQSEHLALNSQVHEQLMVLREKATANAALPVTAETTDPDGLGFVDYWTGGGNTAASAEIDSRLRAVEADELNGDTLRAVLTDDAPRLADRLDELVAVATTTEINSQLRASIADLVVDVLAGNGYDIEIDGGYEASDQRRGFVAKADHADGSRVVVTVAPTDDGRAELNVHSFDEDTGDEETRLHRAEVVRTQLQEEGLEMGPLTEAPGGPDARVRDVAAVVAPRSAPAAAGQPAGSTGAARRR